MRAPSGIGESRKRDRIESRAQRFIGLGEDARISERPLHLLEQRLLTIVERATRALERRLRSRNDVGRRLDVGGDPRERLRIDVAEADVSELGRKEIENGSDGGGDSAHDTEHTFSV